MTLLRWLTILLGSLTVTIKVLIFSICIFISSVYLFYNVFPFIGRFWLGCCFSFHWLSNKLKTGCPYFIAELITAFALIGMASMIISETKLMDLNLPSLGSLVLDACCGMFYITRFQIYWRFGTNNMVFESTLIWYHPPVIFMLQQPVLTCWWELRLQKLLPCRINMSGD